MSGGAFDYIQMRPEWDEAEEYIQKLIKDGGEYGDFIDGTNFKPLDTATIEELKKGLQKIKEARVYLQRIDWFLSGDDGENAFHERLKEDLNKLKT